MRDYAKISPQFWIGETGRQIRMLGCEAQVLALYLLTSPHSNMLGLYYCPTVMMAHETGSPFEGASKALRSLCETGFCSYDPLSEVIWVHEMARFQIEPSLSANDKRCVGIQKEYDHLPNNPFLKAFFDKYKDAFHLKTARNPGGGGNGKTSPFEGASKALRSQEQEQEQEQEDKEEKTCASDDAPELDLDEPPIDKIDPDGFGRWYSEYPLKRAKQDAMKAWRQIKPSAEQQKLMMQAIQAWQQDKAAKKARGFTEAWPLPASWLRGRRWEDVLGDDDAQMNATSGSGYMGVAI